ncbi:MAG: V-type ATP synthase subunit I [Hyphomicrobiaceae bacterium]
MSIVPLKRVTIYGLTSDKPTLLDELQDAGCMHLLPLCPPHPLALSDPELMRRAKAAHRHLRYAPVKLSPWPRRHKIDLAQVIGDTLRNKTTLRRANDKRDALVARIAALSPFGNFVLPPEADLRGRKLWFYMLPAKNRAALARIDLPWQIVGEEKRILYVVVVAKDEPAADLLPVPRTHTGSRALADLQAELEQTEIEIEDAQTERAQLARSELALGLGLEDAEDAEDRRAADGMTRDEGRLFALQGWVPEPDAPRLAELAGRQDLALVVEAPAKDDTPPTLLENPGALSGAGGLTTFFKVPDYATWDPSLIVYFSFAIFFAMILADAGYAAVLGLLLAFYWRRMGRSMGARKARAMLIGILAVAFVYGCMVGGYFGVEPPKGSLLDKIAFIDVNNFAVMMRFSIVVGVLHIALANAEIVVRRWGTWTAVESWAWIVVLFSGLLIWLLPMTVWYAVLAAGLVVVALAAGAEHPIERPLDWLLRIAFGILGATHVTKLFGDILSYMRLFALGLASASLATTFNHLAGEVASGHPGLGVLFAILILVFGHLINIALGILSGVVHGLRLNYIEFFGWALPGEGYPFKAFKRRNRTSWKV